MSASRTLSPTAGSAGRRAAAGTDARPVATGWPKLAAAGIAAAGLAADAVIEEGEEAGAGLAKEGFDGAVGGKPAGVNGTGVGDGGGGDESGGGGEGS